MWLYSQTTGRLTQNGALIGVGYAGHPPYVNDPTAQSQHNIGPLPEGLYIIGEAVTNDLGPLAMPLEPDLANEMYGRSGFFIHGDNPEHPGWSSNGCIVISHDVRQQISVSPDRALTVTW